MICILAIETSGEACSAAILTYPSHHLPYQVEDSTVYSVFEVAPRQHTKMILGMVEDVMAKASISREDITAIALSNGPGAFTGLRIAAGVAQGLALACDVPIIAVSTLRAVALAAFEHTQQPAIFVANDARMQELYWACYQCSKEEITLLGEEQLAPLHTLPMLPEGRWYGAGSGWQVVKEHLTECYETQLCGYDDYFPAAAAVAKLAAQDYFAGKQCTVDTLELTYLRNKVAETVAEREAKKKKI